MAAEFGEFVIFEDDERLDEIDASAFQSLVYDYINRVVSAIMGPCEGVMGPATYSVVDTAILFSKMMLIGVKANGGYLADGGVIHVDPSNGYFDPPQFNCAPFANAGVCIWWKRNAIEADDDDRRKWTGPGPIDVNVSMLTRRRETVSFEGVVGYEFTMPPGTAGTWYRLAQARVNAAGQPEVIVFKHALDPSPWIETDYPIGILGHSMMTNEVGGDAYVSGAHAGMARALTKLTNGLMQTITSSLVVDPETDLQTSRPDVDIGYHSNRGTKELDADLTTAETALAGRTRNLLWFYCSDAGVITNAAGDAIELGGVAPTLSSHPSTGVFIYDLTGTGVTLDQTKQIVLASSWSDPHIGAGVIVNSPTQITVTMGVSYNVNPIDAAHKVMVVGKF